MKVYIIVSVQPSTGRVAGLFGPDHEWDLRRWEVNEERSMRYREAAPELREQVRETVVDRFPDEAENLMANSGDKALLFTRRKAARVVASNLNEAGSWDWRVIECGEAVDRDVRPVLGWRIMYGVNVSSHNADHPDDMFPTRKAAREYYRRHDLRIERNDDGSPFYRIKPVYGAYRVDPKYPGETHYAEGGLRFRTKGAAEQFARGTYHDDVGGKVWQEYRVTLHDEPVPESLLWDNEA